MMEAVKEKVELQRYPEYNDSGLDWLGEIPKGWGLKRANYVFDIIDERSKTGKEELLSVSEHHGVKKRSESSVNMFMAESYKGYKLCYPGDLVINSLWAWSRGLGVSDQKGIVSTAYSVFRPDHENYDQKFLHYLLRTRKYVAQYLIVSKGIWISRLQLSDWAFLRIPILSPPKEEQTAIANFLDRKTEQINQAIEIKQKQIELLKERRQILIHKAVTRGLNPDVSLKPSGVDWIGDIPEHWVIVSNRQLFVERKYPGNDFLPILTVSIHTAVSLNEMDEEDNIRGKIRIDDKSNYKRVEEGFIVFNMMRAWQGAIGAVSNKGMVSPAYIVAEPIDEIVPKFFEYQYRTESFIQQMNRNSKGITDFRKRLYWDEFKQLNTVLPPILEQKQIINYIEKLSSKTSAAITLQQKQIQKLKEYKNTLINSAVTGKIKVV